MSCRSLPARIWIKKVLGRKCLPRIRNKKKVHGYSHRQKNMEAPTLAPANSNLEENEASISFSNNPSRVDDLNISKITDLEPTIDISEASVLVERLEDMMLYKKGDIYSSENGGYNTQFKKKSKTDAYKGRASPVRETTASSPEKPSVPTEQVHSHQTFKRLALGMDSIRSSVKRRRCSAPETKDRTLHSRHSRKNRSSSLTELASGEKFPKKPNVINISFKKTWRIVNPEESTKLSQERKKHSHKKKTKHERRKIVMELSPEPACHPSGGTEQIGLEPDNTPVAHDVPPTDMISERVDLKHDSSVSKRTENKSCMDDKPSSPRINLMITHGDKTNENSSRNNSPPLMVDRFQNVITAEPETTTCDPVRDISETSGLIREERTRLVFDNEDSNTRSEDSNEDELTLRIDEDTKSECSEKSFSNYTEEKDFEGLKIAETRYENDPYRGPKKKYISKKNTSTTPDSTNRSPSPISPQSPSRLSKQATQTHSSLKYRDNDETNSRKHSELANDSLLPNIYRKDSFDKTQQTRNKTRAVPEPDSSQHRHRERSKSDTTPQTRPSGNSPGKRQSQLEIVDDSGEEKVSKKTRSSRRNFKHENISIMKPQSWEYRPALSIINSPKLLGALNAIEGINNNSNNNDLNLITLHGVKQSSEEESDTAILINYPSSKATPGGEPEEEGAGKGTRRKGRSGRKSLVGAEDHEGAPTKSTPSGPVVSEVLSTKEEADSTVKLSPRKRKRGRKKQNADISAEEQVTLTRLENENRLKDARLAVDIPSHNWLAKKFKVTSDLHEIDTNSKSSLNVSTTSHRPEKTNNSERNLLPSRQNLISSEEPLGDFDTEHRKMARRNPVIESTALDKSKGSPVPATLQPLELQNITSQLDLQVSLTEVTRGSPPQGQVRPQPADAQRAEQARPEKTQLYTQQSGETRPQVRQLEQVCQPQMRQILPREEPPTETQAAPVKPAVDITPDRDMTLEEQLESASKLGQLYKQEQQRQLHSRGGHAGGMFYPHGRSVQHQGLPVRNPAQRLIPPAPASIPISFDPSHGRQITPCGNAAVGFFNPTQGPQDQVGRMTYLQYHVETEPISPKHQVEYPPFLEHSGSPPGRVTRDGRIGADVPDRPANPRQRQAYDDPRRMESSAVARWHQEQFRSNRRPGEGPSGRNEGALTVANDASRDHGGQSLISQSQFNRMFVSYLVDVLSQNASGQFDRGHYLNNGSLSEGYALNQVVSPLPPLQVQQALLQSQIDTLSSLITNNNAQQLSQKEIQLMLHELRRLNNLQAERNRHLEQNAAQNWNTTLALRQHVSPSNFNQQQRWETEPLDQEIQAQPAVPNATSAAMRNYSPTLPGASAVPNATSAAMRNYSPTLPGASAVSNATSAAMRNYSPNPPGASYYPSPHKPPTKRRTSRSSPVNAKSLRPYATSTPRPMDLTVRRQATPDRHGVIIVDGNVDLQQGPFYIPSNPFSPQTNMERPVININPNRVDHLIPTTSPMDIIVTEPYGAYRNGVPPPPYPGGYGIQQSHPRENSSQIIIQPAEFFSENPQRHHQMQAQHHRQMNAANQLYVQQRQLYQVPPPQLQIRYNQTNASHQRRPRNQPQNANQGQYRRDEMTGTVQPLQQQHLPLSRISREGCRQERFVFDQRQPPYMAHQPSPTSLPGDNYVARQNAAYMLVRPPRGCNPTQRSVAPNVCVDRLNNQRHGTSRTQCSPESDRKGSPVVSDKLICSNCDSVAKFICSACQQVSYCSQDCQTQHWSRHSLDCKNNKIENSK